MNIKKEEMSLAIKIFSNLILTLLGIVIIIAFISQLNNYSHDGYTVILYFTLFYYLLLIFRALIQRYINFSNIITSVIFTSTYFTGFIFYGTITYQWRSYDDVVWLIPPAIINLIMFFSYTFVTVYLVIKLIKQFGSMKNVLFELKKKLK